MCGFVKISCASFFCHPWTPNPPNSTTDTQHKTANCPISYHQPLHILHLYLTQVLRNQKSLQSQSASQIINTYISTYHHHSTISLNPRPVPVRPAAAAAATFTAPYTLTRCFVCRFNTNARLRQKHTKPTHQFPTLPSFSPQPTQIQSLSRSTGI